MTELEYVIGRFDEKFHGFCGKRILLHGSREYAEGILKAFDPLYGFLGVMTFDPVGDSFCGKPVFGSDRLTELKPDLIILTERVRYAEAAFESLACLCENDGIALYDMYGLDELALHRDLEACRNHSLAGWQELVAPYDVVAFELMDTFLTLSLLKGQAVVREFLKQLARDLLACGTPVFFSLRRSYPEQKQIEYLWNTGLFSSREAMEACLIRRKGEDLSFRALRERYPRAKILYIGMGLVYECILPRYYDIDTYRMRLTIDLLCPKRPKIVQEEMPRQWDLNQLREALARCDAVSFDVFDTLLQRKTLQPTDVFRLVERKVQQAGISALNFAERRIAAQDLDPFTNIDGIYRRMKLNTGWPQETLDSLLAMEVETERAVLMPRAPMIEVFREAVRSGKRVVLTSDMYLPERILSQLLAEKGVEGYEKLFVSCDEGCCKANGLFDRVRTYLGDAKILHIGDNVDADLDPARAAGFEGFYVPSALRTALDCGWEKAIGKAESLTERCLVGLSVAVAFEDPFIPHAIEQAKTNVRLQRYAAGAVAPMIAGYLCWLASELRDSNAARVLFLARDGWLPMAGYECLRRRWPELSLPEPTYLYANRRAAFLGVMEQFLGTMFFNNQGYNNGLAPNQILRNVFDLAPENILPWREGEQTPQQYLLRHRPAVHVRQTQVRTGLVRYADSLALRSGEPYAVVDFVALGSTQAYLEQILPLTLRGYYFARPLYDNEGVDCDVRYYLQGENDFFLRNFVEAEHFITSSEPSVDYIAEDGTPVLAEEVRSAEDLREFTFAGEVIRTYLRTFFELFYAPGDTIRPELPEELYAADGYHWVTKGVYDDWFKKPIQ